MKISSRAFSILAIGAAAIPMVRAQASADYRVVIDEGGQFKLLCNAQQVQSLRFGLFYDNWKELNLVGQGKLADGSFQAKGSLGSGDMNVNTQVTFVGSTARFTIRATPTRTLTADSAHLNIRFDPAFWAEARFTAGSWSTIFPRRLDSSVYKTDTVNSWNAKTPGNFQLSFNIPAPAKYALKDSRIYNVGFEMRAMETNGTWPANQTKTYVIDITPNVAMPIGTDQPVQLSANSDWIPLTNFTSISPGSALDWSKPNVPEAGSQGWLKTSANGKFYFENDPTQTVRFYGTNLAGYACYLNRGEADWVANELAKHGYNAVRLHHFDYLLTSPTAPNSTTLDADQMDRLCYLLYALKKKGIYITLDLYTLREPKNNEIISGTVPQHEYKAMLLYSSAARNNWLQFSMNLLNYTNPYTGLKLKDDPAIAWVSMVNENSPLWLKPGSVRPEIQNGLNTAAGGTWDVLSDVGARKAMDVAGSMYDWMKTQLRNGGVKALFTMMNAGENTAMTRIRSKFDFVDDHVYYATPVYLGTRFLVPYTQPSVPPMARLMDFGRYAAARIVNKPFTATEADAVAPNPYRGEFGLVMGAVASVQQWDGIWRFGFSDRPERWRTVGPIDAFCTLTDPGNFASEKALIALFLRGDLTATDAPTIINVPFDSTGLSELKEVPLVKNGALLKPIAFSHSLGVSSPATPILDGMSVRPDGSVVADLFQQSLRINTPRTVGVVATPGVPLQAGRMMVTIDKARASVWATSLDGLEIGSSRRILVAHLTEVQNTGTYWTGVQRETVTSMGGLPHLVRDGSASIKLSVSYPSSAKVYRLDMAGRRVAQVPLTKSFSDITFTATTLNPNDGKATIFYEVVK